MKEALYGLYQYVLIVFANYYTEAINIGSFPAVITLFAISTGFYALICHWIDKAKRNSRGA